jgi:hypothetical protein
LSDAVEFLRSAGGMVSEPGDGKGLHNCRIQNESSVLTAVSASVLFLCQPGNQSAR